MQSEWQADVVGVSLKPLSLPVKGFSSGRDTRPGPIAVTYSYSSSSGLSLCLLARWQSRSDIHTHTCTSFQHSSRAQADSPHTRRDR